MVNAVKPPEISMRALILATVLGTAFTVIGAASAQDRTVITIKPRSWLDAGTHVPVGSMQNYMYDTGGSSDISRFGARSGNAGLLPDRHTAGRGFAFETPLFRGFD
jgi:hypothetical protein